MSPSLLDALRTISTHTVQGPITPGMQVVDRHGDRVGTVAAVHRDVLVEVKTGPLGLGRRYYVPFGAFRAVGRDGAILTKGRDELGALGFDRTPAFVE